LGAGQKKLRAQFEQKGVTAKSEVRIGIAAEQITRLADEICADLVAMSTHGRSGINRWALGSVADKVVRATERRIALIRAKDARADMREKGLLNRVLVPLNGSELAEVALPYAEELAGRLGSMLKKWISV